MILYYGQIKLNAYRYRKPLMDNNKGRIWIKNKIYIDKEPIACNFDSKFGNYIYFDYKNVHYRFSMMGEYYDEISKNIKRYSFDPLTEEVHLSTNLFSISK